MLSTHAPSRATEFDNRPLSKDKAKQIYFSDGADSIRKPGRPRLFSRSLLVQRTSQGCNFMVMHFDVQSNAYLQAIYDPNDFVTLRPIETWTENGKKHSRVIYDLSATKAVDEWLQVALPPKIEEISGQRGNVFIGVCPRQSGEGSFELAWQIAIVRVLWADVDHCTVEEVQQRIEAVSLPEPTMIVSSGNGCHLYWWLTEPILTGAPAIGVQQQWTLINGKNRPIRYMIVDDNKVWLDNPETGRPILANRPELTDIALRVQDTLQGIAAAIHGDHTQDLSRLLRLPGTMNRKNERNGDSPKPCELVFLDPERRYPFEVFASFAEQAPAKVKRDAVAAIPLPALRNLTAAKTDTLEGKILLCQTARQGTRSEADFHLSAWAIEKGIAKSQVWMRCRTVGKFAECGESYFDRTWDKAADHVRETKYNKAHGIVDQDGMQNDDDDATSRIAIELTTDEKSVNDQVRQALANRGDIYDHFGRVAMIVDRQVNGESRKQIKELCRSTLRELISETCTFHPASEAGSSWKSGVHVPNWCSEAIADGGSWTGLQPFNGIVTCPLLRQDGTVLQSLGYDSSSGIYLDLIDSFPAISDFPSAEQVAQAVVDLLDPVIDFPFLNEACRSAWIAGLFTPLACEAHSGVVGPLFLLDANVRGSGKSRLADMISIIVTGQLASRTTETSSDEEMRKRITAFVKHDIRMVLLDNVATLGGAAMDAALTGQLWRDRQLGNNQLIQAALRIAWFASGNNVVPVGDMARRVCHIRLESPLERPETRNDFKYPDILKHVRDNRTGLLTAALTILRGYIAAGRPDQHLPSWGSFEEWSDLVRNSIVWCGLPDPGETREEFCDSVDEDTQTLRQMLSALQYADPGKEGMRVSQMLDDCSQQHSSIPQIYARMLREAIEVLCGCAITKVTSTILGSKLKRFKGRLINGQCLATKKNNGNNCWYVQGAGGHGGHGGPLLPQPSEPEQEIVFSETTTLSQNTSPTSTSSTSDDDTAETNDLLLFSDGDPHTLMTLDESQAQGPEMDVEVNLSASTETEDDYEDNLGLT